MNLRRAGKGIVRKGKRPSVYRIGFNDGDETELTANGIMSNSHIQIKFMELIFLKRTFRQIV